MNVVNSKLQTPNSKLAAKRSDARGLMSADEVAELFGYKSGEAIRKQEGPRGIEKLTVVDISRADSQRRTLRWIQSEVIALYDEIVENAQRYKTKLKFDLIDGGKEAQPRA